MCMGKALRLVSGVYTQAYNSENYRLHLQHNLLSKTTLLPNVRELERHNGK